jgi:hypothetical protein
MNDTDKKIKEIQRDMLMRFSGIERLKMGSSMFTSARRLMQARLKIEITDPIELQVQLFEQTYQNDFSKEQLAKISNKIKAYWHKQRLI